MISFVVSDMTCGHCASTITKALKMADQDAKVQIDLARHLVQVEHGESGSDQLAQAIKDVGFTPVPATMNIPAATVARSGCGCGCR